MRKKSTLIGIVVSVITAFAFLVPNTTTPADEVKSYYQQELKQFYKDIIQLRQVSLAGNLQALQAQFKKARNTYKHIEVIVEYYFSFSAVKLNGPAVPFFEEEEPDVGEQQPAGMQVIEGLIYPGFKKESQAALLEAVDNLLLDTQTLEATNESFAFNDEFIFDAITEELYRITALGLTSFDSQNALNGLSECREALTGLQKLVSFYENDIRQTAGTGRYNVLQALFKKAEGYLLQNTSFNSFNRMEFIEKYLNPITEITGRYKQNKGFGANKSPMYYSSIRKNNTLFAPDIFDAGKYLDDNTTSPQKIMLGKKLFFERQLSADGKRSCATCHNPQKGFTDGLVTSLAMDGHSKLLRNAPTLWNAALQRNLFWDSRSPSLEDQVMQVLNNANEMHGSAEVAAGKILSQPSYSILYTTAYNTTDKSLAARNICNAIACYERTLIALDSRFDKHMRGQHRLTQREINGFNLFMGKAKCGTCHFMPLFSGAKPPRYYYNESEVIGVPANEGKANAILDEDQGRFLVTGLPVHKFAFKTPTLRNIALTAPYMHNGVFKTLNDVLNFYNNGGGAGLHIAPANQSLPATKLNLTKVEIEQILAFLKTL